MTIKDIAKACGVGVSTVSRVLNERPDVSPEVRERVLQMVESTGYIPNNSARDLGRSQTDTIGVVVRGMGNLFFSQVLNTITQEVDRTGYTLVPRFIDSDADEVKAGAILEREKKLRGLIFLGGRFDYSASELSLVGVPYVCCSFTNRFGSLSEEEYSSVCIDDFHTAFRAVELLIAHGHRRIAALVPSRSDHSISELRFEGYKAALAEHGIPYDESLVVETGGCFTMPESYEGVCRLLKRTAEFTAAFVLSDTTALAAIKALEDHGRRVPEDVSVIAIDGLEISAYTTPTLSTMVQPAEEMGRESVRLLMEILKGGPHRHVCLETSLREGGSLRSL